MEQTLISTHIFLFPFKWEHNGFADMSGMRNALGKEWKHYNDFSLTTLSAYNEYNFFHDFTRKILYDLDQSSLPHDPGEDIFLDHYVHNSTSSGNSVYLIQINTQEEFDRKANENKAKQDNCYYGKNLYELEVDRDGILLHLYNNGVGVLSFHLSNRKEDQKADIDILLINQFGRRLFPPFFTIDKNKIGTKDAFDDDSFDSGFAKALGVVFPFSIRIERKSENDTKTAEPIEPVKKEKPDYSSGMFRLPNFINELFPAEIRPNNLGNTLKISPVLDDRMYIISWYGNNNLGKNVALNDTYLTCDWWFKFVFVDTGMKTCQNESMTRSLLSKSTNPRWSGYNTVYGASSYSFVCLTNDLITLKGNNAEFIPHHMQTIYYKMVELVLLQRTCLLLFSERITTISGHLGDKDYDLGKHVGSLYEDYIRFINKIYFREITPQDQGIELYNLLQDQMKIPQNVKELKEEIKDLHDYVSLQEDELRNKKLNLLTIINFIFLPVSVVLAFFGMNYFGKDDLQVDPFKNFADSQSLYSVFWALGFLVLTIVFSLLVWQAIRKEYTFKKMFSKK